MGPRTEETLLPPESGFEAEAPPRGAFRERTRVRVKLVRTPLPRSDRLGELGAGVLVGRLALGQPLRVALDGAPSLVTSPVQGFRRLGPDRVEVATAHSVYHLEREAVDGGDAPAPDRARGRAGPATDPAGSPACDDSSAFVPLGALARPGGTPLAPGARMRISRLRTHDPGAERLGELGVGRVLDPLEVGQTLRLSLEAGPTFVTSPIRAVHRLGEGLTEVQTANSTYRLQRLEE